MYHLYFGNDESGVRVAALAAASAAIGEDATLTKIDGENYQPGMIADALGAESLFGGKEIFVLDTPSAHTKFEEEVSSSLESLQESQNTFYIIEGPLLAAAKKKLGKNAESIEECKLEKTERFNVFAMADALAAKDKKKLWLLLTEAKAAGLVAEEIIGTLWWQLKTLRLAAITRSASEAGLKDFPYNKAKRSLSVFKEGELTTLSRSLLKVYHDGHNGRCDINLALEKWALEL